LLLTRIRCNDVIEHRRQSHCRLAVSSAAIPSELTTWRAAAEILEHLLRVMRPKLRIIRCLLRKIILKAHAPCHSEPSRVATAAKQRPGFQISGLLAALSGNRTGRAAQGVGLVAAAGAPLDSILIALIT